MASTIRITSTVSGTLNGVVHTLAGARSLNINGINAQSFDVTTAYADAAYDNTIQYQRALISNDGANEVKVRIERSAATTWEYHNIPAGKAIEILNSSTTVGVSNIGQISVKATLGVSRVTVLQAWT